VPTSPTIILLAGLFYLLALFFGPHGGLKHHLYRGRRASLGGAGLLGGVLLSVGILGGFGEQAWAQSDLQLMAANATDQSALDSVDSVQVVASFPVVADITKQIGGSAVQLHTIVGPERSAHHFEPSARDMQTLIDADLLVLNGAGLKPWAQPSVQAADF